MFDPKGRYSRHLLLEGIGQQGQERLAHGRVLIVGAGGLGSPVALYLAAAGVGTIGIADGDTVDVTNLQRQVIHSTNDVGVAKVASAARKMRDINPDINVESSHITEFAADLGLYFSLPIGERFAIGTKALIGRSIIQDLDINARFEGYKLEKTAEGFALNNEKYDTGAYDYLTVSGDNTMKYGTGLSLTYAYKSNFSWKLFFDYDFTRKHYTMEYDYAGFLRSAWPTITADTGLDVSQPSRSEIKKNLNNFVLGGAFCVIGQLLIDLTKLTPARILVSYVVAGVILGAVGVYEPLIEFAGGGATVPLTGFGSLLAKGVREAVDKHGLIGAFMGGFTSSAAGIAAAIFFGLLAALCFKSGSKINET